MATYPTSIKSFTNPSASTTMDTPGLELDSVISDLNGEVNAIETELGTAPKTITEATTPTASPSSVAEFLDMVATQLKAIAGGSHWYSSIATSLASIVTTATTTDSTLNSHIANVSNPHSVTKSQVGLGNVTNDAQIPSTYLDVDGTLAADSDTKVPSQKAVKTYVDSNSGATDGWISDSDTYVYVSANSFKITGKDVTARFPKGTRVKFTNNSTTVYGFVISSSFSTNTTVTLFSNTDYSIANSAITAPYYSYQQAPQGYPGTFNFTPAYANMTVGNATNTGYASCVGNVISVACKLVYGSTSSMSGNVAFTFPVTPASYYEVGVVYMEDVGVAAYYGWIEMANGSNGRLRPDGGSGVSSTAPLTWGTGDFWNFSLTYKF